MAYDLAALPDVSELAVGIIGGTGDQGRGLAYRLLHAGQEVLIGSRSPQRAARAAAELATLPAPGGGGVSGPAGGPGDAPPWPARRGAVVGGGNADVAARADIVIVAVPWSAHAETLGELREPLAGKVVVDCVNPLGFDRHGAHVLPVPGGSATQQAATLLPDARVCGAFHHVSAVLLADPEVERIELDVLVCADDREVAAVAQALAARIPGIRGVYAGRLRNAGQVEALTANLIAINRRYRTHAGLRVTDL